MFEFQEAMQNVRKSKTIQQDKLRSLSTCFLANILQDYYHNLGMHKVLICSWQDESLIIKWLGVNDSIWKLG